ncbi:MAG: hypothetical protein KME13_21715 [Myxacorys californica WJT36-NPBG1]|jgi:hypothetical protein|nr:hypothetical protein [Myxacorys californica WJT36-NPBG1]
MAGYRTPPGTIINTIKSLLRERYKQGFPIIKEIIQNANDGKATSLDFGIARGLDSNISHPLLKTPALFFLNNGTFNKEDQEAISCFGIDANAKDKGKIGKFGLGQKSVFHFCEAFFYIARSSNISEGCGEFINPWATSEGVDAKRPEWTEISQVDLQHLENYLITQKLITPNTPQYFLLWVPLRQRMPDERCILANYYEDLSSVRDNLPADMEARIGQLLPLLRHLKKVKYWLPETKGSLQQHFHIQLDEKSALARCIYPDAANEAIEPDEHDLEGNVLLSSSNNIKFAGKERILPATDFARLLPGAANNSSHFWKDLQTSSLWTRRSSINENGDEEMIPDKSIPHCAVVLTQQPSSENGSAKVTLQWSVFLPLSSDENNSSTESAEQEVHQQISCEGNQDYTIFLHGYFFLDSGRKYIEGLQSIRSNSFKQKTPETEDEMIAQWNYLLAMKGTLKLVLPALEKLCGTHNLSANEITHLCNGIRQSRLYTIKTYRERICEEYQWVFSTEPSGSSWQMVSANISVRLLPGIPDWQAFPSLESLAENHYLILSDKPNLLPYTDSAWKPDEICALLENLNIRSVFSEPNALSYLLNVLKQNEKAVKHTEVQAHLMTVLGKAFIKFDTQKPQQKTLLPLIQNLVAYLAPDKRFKISSFEANEQVRHGVLKQLYELDLNLLPIYASFEPSLFSSTGTLSHESVVVVLTKLSQVLTEDAARQKVICELICQVLEQLKQTGSLEAILKALEQLPLFIGYNHRDQESYLYPYVILQVYHSQKCLFRGDGRTNKLANSLRDAVSSCPIVFIDTNLANILTGADSLKGLPALNAKSCLSLLSTKPDLTNPQNRTNLLTELMDRV